MFEYYTSDKKRIRSYGSYGEFLKACLGSSDMPMEQRRSRNAGDEWCGGSWAHAEKTGVNGDREGAKALRSAIVKEANRIMGQVPRLDPVYRKEGGIWIDVSRYLSGEPEVWGDMIDLGAERKARRAAIVFNASATWEVSSKDYAKVARLMGGAILGIKAMGISVSLHVTYANSGRDDCEIPAILMTQGEGFDVAQLAAVCQTWFFRRLVFSYFEGRDATYRDKHDVFLDGGYGQSIPITDKDAQAITHHAGAIVLNLEDMVKWDEKTIQDAILRAIKSKEAVS